MMASAIRAETSGKIEWEPQVRLLLKFREEREDNRRLIDLLNDGSNASWWDEKPVAEVLQAAAQSARGETEKRTQGKIAKDLALNLAPGRPAGTVTTRMLNLFPDCEEVSLRTRAASLLSLLAATPRPHGQKNPLPTISFSCFS